MLKGRKPRSGNGGEDQDRKQVSAENLTIDQSSLVLEVSNFSQSLETKLKSNETPEYGSANSILSDFARDIYTEKTVGPSEILQVEIPFDRSSYGEQVSLKWEYISRTEQTPYFSFRYIADGDGSPMTQLPDRTVSHTAFPLSNVECYTKPAYGAIPVSSLASGKFVFTWDNSVPFSKRTAKLVTYKIGFVNGYNKHEFHLQVEVPRKSSFAMPLTFHENDELFGFDISIEYSTGNFNIPFSVQFDPTSEPAEEKEKHNPDINERLNNLVTNENGVFKRSPALTRRTIIPFNKNISRGPIIPVSHRIPLENTCGVYTLIWDNSSSIISNRHVDFQVQVVKTI